VTAPTADRQSNSCHVCILSMYKCLLADISLLSRVPLGAPDEITDEWVLKTGPKLDKELLMYIEGVGDLPTFPYWLQPLVDKFLSSSDGNTLKYIRQLLLFCYKVEFEPTNDQLKEAQTSFEDTDAAIDVWESYFKTTDHHMFAAARQIVSKVIYRIDWTAIMPSHGPGAVYPPAKPHVKSKFDCIYSSIEQVYPYYDYFCALPSVGNELGDRLGAYLQSRDDIIARLDAVPKDSRGPRLICVHPKEAVWIQQGCRRLLEQAIESVRSPCRGRITFRDQSTNGSLALASSIDREYCTLDLKEASDRISCALVRYLFGDYAYRYISCSRANKVKLLDGRVIELRKWAPMGNALTFPVQSLVFFALVRAGIRSRYGVNCNDVYVFGDDILFPSRFYEGALSGLIRAGLIPNPGKTFRHGFFRESCGVDAFKGINVTPIRMKKTDVRSVSGAFSVCTLAKRLMLQGYRSASDLLYRYVESEFGPLPLSNNPFAQGLCRYEKCSFDKLLRYEKSTRFNRRYHRWETKLLLVRGASISISNGAWWHLQDSILRLHHRGDGGISDRGLEYAVPHRVRLKRGWTETLLSPDCKGPQGESPEEFLQSLSGLLDN
jgi:hypothetical protein